MDKQNWKSAKAKVNTTSSMEELKIGESQKGYSSSSHYRISSGAVATKFVQWEVQPLENLSSCKAYLLREQLNRGERMSREDGLLRALPEKKNWLCEAVNSNTCFRTAVPLQGWRFDFFDVLKKYLVNQYGHWAENLYLFYLYNGID